MKVLFINPPREGFFLITERQVPLGIYYLMEACRKSGFEVNIIDTLVGAISPKTIPFEELSSAQKERASKNPIFGDYVRLGIPDKQVIAKIEEWKPAVICMSIMFSCFHDAAERLAQKIKHQFPHIVIIAGGAHVTTHYKNVLSTGLFDYCLRYEGEKTLPSLLKAIEGKLPTENVEGIAYGQNPTVENPHHTWIRDLDELRPAYDLMSAEDYLHTMTIITSRGCPFACEFCTVHLSMGRQYRARSVENVIDELLIYSKAGFTRFNIEDDNFTFDVERAKAICRGIIDRKIECDIYLPNGIAAKSLDEECIRLFALAGVKKLFLGLETTSKHLLSALKKEHASLEIIQEKISLCKHYKMNAGASLIIGFPSQTLDDILADITTLIKANIPIYAFNALYPLPGTEIHEDCIKDGILTGEEDLIFLGSDNFVMHNHSFSREDLYDLWVTIKGYSKWGHLHGNYYTPDAFEIDEALGFIAHALNGNAQNATLEVKAISINADLISAHYKVFSDMTRCFLFLLTGKWCDCCITEGENVQIEYTLSSAPIPRALAALKSRLKQKG